MYSCDAVVISLEWERTFFGQVRKFKVGQSKSMGQLLKIRSMTHITIRSIMHIENQKHDAHEWNR